MNLVDTSGWIEFLFSGPNADYFAAPIERTDELLVPTICMYEVFKKVSLVAQDQQAVEAVGLMRQGCVVDLTEAIAMDAACVSVKYRLPMADSIICATARAHDAQVWTQDEDFEHLPGVNYRPASTNRTGKQTGPL